MFKKVIFTLLHHAEKLTFINMKGYTNDFNFLPYQHNYLKYNNLTIWKKHPDSKREGNKGNFFPYPPIISFPATARNDRTRDILEKKISVFPVIK